MRPVCEAKILSMFQITRWASNLRHCRHCLDRHKLNVLDKFNVYQVSAFKKRNETPPFPHNASQILKKRRARQYIDSECGACVDSFF